MKSKYKFGLRFKKGNFSPESSRPQEIADLITHIEKIVTALVEKQFSRSVKWGDTIEFSLSSVKSGSLVCNFVTESENIKDIWCEVSKAVKRNNFSNWPDKAIDATVKIQNFSRTHNTPAEYWHYNGEYKTLAIMMPDTEIKTEPVIRTGTTTLYGRLYRIGGDTTPYADLILLNGSRQRCKVNSFALASEMANQLYKRVGVRGTATWYVSDLTIKEFMISSVTPYKQVPISNAMESLANLTVQDYQAIEDINSFVSEVRGTGDNES